MPRKDGKRRGRGRVQRVSWNDSLSVMRARTKESPLYTTECSVYYNGQWLTSPPIETNTWDVYICTCMYICDEVLTGSTYKGSHMVLRVRLILKKKKKSIKFTFPQTDENIDMGMYTVHKFFP